MNRRIFHIVFGLVSIAIFAAVLSLDVQAQVLNPANGHYYELVDADEFTWAEARADAETRSFAGFQGHLATITSAQEHDFIVNNILIEGDVWIGGFQPPGTAEPAAGFQWVTGEPFSYTNWADGEPNNAFGDGEEDALILRNFDGDGVFWNDYFDDAELYYIVEYGPLPVGQLFVADTTNHRIQAFTGESWIVVGVGTVGSGAGQFRSPEAVAVSSVMDSSRRHSGFGTNGVVTGMTIYVADTGNNRIQWSQDGGICWSDFATVGSALNQVRAPQGLAVDQEGNLYVSDTGNGRVLRFDDGVPGFATILATNGVASGQVRSPRGLAVDSSFRLFVTDAVNNRILRINNANTVTLSTTGVVIATQGTALNKVNGPQGITIDGLGDLYVADTGNSRILRWRNANPTVANSSAMALPGSLLGQVNNAEGVTVSQFDSGPFAGGPILIVGDTLNNRIQGRFIPTGQWTFIGFPNGTGTGFGQFRGPSKIQ